MRSALVIAGIAAAIAVAQPAAAQRVPFGIELQVAGASPTGSWNNDKELGNGYGFGAVLHYRPSSFLGLYGGWERFEFTVDDKGLFGGADLKAHDTGFKLGAEMGVHSSGLSGLRPFVYGGVVYDSNRTSVTGEGGSVNFDSSSSIGFEGGVGASFGSGRIKIRPNLAYKTRPTEYDANAGFGEHAEKVNYLSLRIGLQVNLDR